MNRIKPLDPETCDGLPKLLLQSLQETGAPLPNLYRTMAHAPAAIEGYHFFSQSLDRSKLDKRTRMAIALTVAGANQNDYCASRSAVAARELGIEEEELQGNLMGFSGDSRLATVLRFTRMLMAKHGRVADEDVGALRATGFGDEEITEIVAVVCLNIFSSYFSHVARAELDEPLFRAEQTAAA